MRAASPALGGRTVGRRKVQVRDLFQKVETILHRTLFLLAKINIDFIFEEC